MNVIDPPEVKATCYHCGEDVADAHYQIDDKKFCCRGCQTVFEIINQHDLCSYYDLEKQPGLNQKTEIRKGKFDFLADETISNKLIRFKQDNIYHVNFYLPQMHCSSCIWILEHLNKIDSGIVKSRVNFIKKEVTIEYKTSETNLSNIATALSQIGYEPHISLNDASKKTIKKIDRGRIVKIGVAGFCFGNIMMLSFPEYFSLGIYEIESFKVWFNYMNLVLSLPVLFYSGTEFFISAFKSIRQKFLNIDAPIALAIAITFLRSVYEIVTNTSSGYLDSMSGIIFFMLIGRYFQNRTYQSISFDRDFTSYFPLGVTVIGKNGEKQVSVTDLKIGNRIKIFNDEIIPADAILFYGKGTIDYSFVTGEAKAVGKMIGEIIYAGGKQTSGAIELEVIKEVSQSYLTQLWNNDAFKEQNGEAKSTSFVQQVSKYFTYVLFSIALISAFYWQQHDPTKVWSAVTAILIVACPCALLLSSTFTDGNMIQMLNKFQFYVKNSLVIERLAKVNTIVFDKTGTITRQYSNYVNFVGDELSYYQKQLVKTLASQSNHPLSRSIVNSLKEYKLLHSKNYDEQKGFGILGVVDGKLVKLGSGEFVNDNHNSDQIEGSKVFVSINGIRSGYYEVRSAYRENLDELVQDLKSEYKLKILSGDNESERERLMKIFGDGTEMMFNQKPQNKLDFIKQLQQNNTSVAMVGDGLNDSGALKQSDVGIAISDNTNNFSPACDVVMAGDNFHLLYDIIRYCKKQKIIIYFCFFVSIVYNVIGLYFAVQGNLQPVIAAVLMPISTVSIVLITISLSWGFSLRLKKKLIRII